MKTQYIIKVRRKSGNACGPYSIGRKYPLQSARSRQILYQAFSAKFTTITDGTVLVPQSGHCLGLVSNECSIATFHASFIVLVSFSPAP
jgi:hypothetical protein